MLMRALGRDDGIDCSKYKFMENQMLENRQRMRMKIPEIERSLEMLRTLEDRREREEKLVTHFPLADNVYAKAQVPAENTVCLWLGVRFRSILLSLLWREPSVASVALGSSGAIFFIRLT